MKTATTSVSTRLGQQHALISFWDVSTSAASANLGCVQASTTAFFAATLKTKALATQLPLSAAEDAVFHRDVQSKGKPPVAGWNTFKISSTGTNQSTIVSFIHQFIHSFKHAHVSTHKHIQGYTHCGSMQ